MATTEENLAAFLLADTAIAAAVGANGIAYNHVPQDDEAPYIFFQQQGADDDVALNDSAGVPTRARYAIECWARTPREAVSLKNVVHPRLHKHRGTFGASTVKGIFAADVDDNYVPNGAGDDSGLHGSFFVAEVVS